MLLRGYVNVRADGPTSQDPQTQASRMVVGAAHSQPGAESVFYMGFCSPTPPLSWALGFCETVWTKHAEWDCGHWRDSEAKAR